MSKERLYPEQESIEQIKDSGFNLKNLRSNLFRIILVLLMLVLISRILFSFSFLNLGPSGPRGCREAGTDYIEMEDITQIETDVDGNIILLGNFFTSYLIIGIYNISNYGNTDAFLASISPEGDINWLRIIGGEYRTEVFEMSNKNDRIAVFGKISSPKSLDASLVWFNTTNHNRKDVVILYNLNGEQIRQWIFDSNSIQHIYLATDNSFIYQDFSGKIAYVQDSSIQWTKDFSNMSDLMLKFDSNNHLYIVGSDVQGVGIYKFHLNGTQIFNSSIGGTNLDTPQQIQLNLKDEVIVFGTTFSNDLPTMDPIQTKKSSEEDTFIMKFDKSGSLVFSTYWGGNSYDRAMQLFITSNDDILLIGSTGSTDLVLKNEIQSTQFNDSNSNKLFITKIHDNKTILFSTYLQIQDSKTILMDQDNNLIFLGSHYLDGESVNSNNSPKGEYDIILTMISSEGVFLGQTYIGGSKSDFISSSAILEDSILIGGSTNSTDISLVPNNIRGKNDLFISSYSPNNGLDWLIIFGGSGLDLIIYTC